MPLPGRRHRLCGMQSAWQGVGIPHTAFLTERLGLPRLQAQRAEESGLGYERARMLDSPALRAGNWSQLCVTCKAPARTLPV